MERFVASNIHENTRIKLITFTVIAADNKFEGTLFGDTNNLVNLEYLDVRKS